MTGPIDEKTVNLIGELSMAAGMARGAKEGLDLMVECGHTDLQLRKLSSTFMQIALIVENVTKAMMGEDVYD